MRKRMQKIVSVILCGICCTALFGGCAGGQPSVSEDGTAAAVEAEGDASESSEGMGADETIEPDEENDAASTAELAAGNDTNDTAAALSENTNSLGEFSMQDIDGETYTQEMFADYDVTMVNIFTTWCTPCINEIPYLEQLKNEMADQGVNVVGIVLDAIDGYGNVDDEAVEKAGLLAERTGAAYPFLIPDDTLLNGRLYGISAVPETIFVDSSGAVIGESYTGSRSLEEWKAVVEEKLSDVSGAAE